MSKSSRCINIKNKLFKRLKKYPSNFNEKSYKSYKKTLNNILKQSEKEHYDNLFKQHSSNAQKSWRIIKSLIGLKKIILNTEFELDGQIITDKNEISNQFNKYFTEVGKN